MPSGAEVRGDDFGIEPAVEVGTEQAVSTLEHRRGSGHAGLRQPCRLDAALCAPARVHQLHVGAFGDELEQAGRHAAGESQCIDELILGQAEQHAGRDARTEGCRDSGGMESPGMESAARRQPDPHRALQAEGDRSQELGARGTHVLGGGQRGRDDGRARMDHRFGVGVVVVFGMRQNPVDERGNGRLRAVRKPEDGGRSRLHAPGERRHRSLDFRRIPGRQADTRDVEQTVLGVGPASRREILERGAAGESGEAFGLMDHGNPVRSFGRDQDLNRRKSGLRFSRKALGPSANSGVL